MKKIIKLLVLIIGMHAGTSSAQTWDELFNQKKTQTRYLLEQIAALKVYIGHLQKTYTIAKDGLDFISKATKGELDLHDDFFNSLLQVNPLVKEQPKVRELLVIDQKIRSNYLRRKDLMKRSGMLSAGELQYIERVFGRIISDCDKILDELKAVSSDGKLEMKDDERIAKIDQLYEDMYTNYQIAESIGNGAIQLASARNLEKIEIKNKRLRNNLNK